MITHVQFVDPAQIDPVVHEQLEDGDGNAWRIDDVSCVPKRGIFVTTSVVVETLELARVTAVRFVTCERVRDEQFRFSIGDPPPV